MKLILKHKVKSAAITIVLLGFGFIHFYLPNVLIAPKNGLIHLINGTPNRPKISDLKANYQPIKIVTKDHLQLNGYTIYSNTTENKGTIILLHGIRAYKEHFFSMCERLANNGYSSVIIDLRGHGDSEGNYCTFGYHEKHDVVTLIDSIMTDDLLNKNIGIWGQSLGGAIALQTMEIDPRIKFGIIESTFSDFNVVAKAYLKRLLKIDNDWFCEYLSHRIDRIAEFDSKRVLPRESVKNITQPTLIVHGTRDNRIDIKHALINFENLKSKNKTLLKIEGANHVNVWQKGGEAYFEKVFSFLDVVSTFNSLSSIK